MNPFNKRKLINWLSLRRTALKGATFVCVISVTAVGAIGLWSVTEEGSNGEIEALLQNTRKTSE